MCDVLLTGPNKIQIRIRIVQRMINPHGMNAQTNAPHKDINVIQNAKCDSSQTIILFMIRNEVTANFKFCCTGNKNGFNGFNVDRCKELEFYQILNELSDKLIN